MCLCRTNDVGSKRRTRQAQRPIMGTAPMPLFHACCTREGSMRAPPQRLHARGSISNVAPRAAAGAGGRRRARTEKAVVGRGATTPAIKQPSTPHLHLAHVTTLLCSRTSRTVAPGTDPIANQQRLSRLMLGVLLPPCYAMTCAFPQHHGRAPNGGSRSRQPVTWTHAYPDRPVLSMTR
ncbi:hypothetical protein T440DRAFT_511692 [Plenodomus tracheiphilus IPT5]|uniref:Uncharacterized protein n=1 Tax=Plenodomus tracheiphilus IPT5 TaxID=1408161 RepID=A0A6A7ARB6_9PLEO|nr:hypothetical protein T440DRAFT_511692 [Plenodomus tracheiphilus IPT5]